MRSRASLQWSDRGDARGRRRDARACRPDRRAGGAGAGGDAPSPAFRPPYRARGAYRARRARRMAAGGMNPDQSEAWETYPRAERATGEPALVVDVEGFEGPLDLLLALARSQKVDITRISILALAEQYLTFIEEIRRLRLEVAADYLVMAAWLAYLKSRLLLPATAPGEGPSAEEMALALAHRLRRLEGIRDVAERLFGQPLLDRDIFSRGEPEPIAHIKRPEWTATLYDLLSAYASQRQKHALAHLHYAKRTVWSLAEARGVLERLIVQSAD